ncbi:MAG: peptidoglycan-binding protein [Clostridia bacterium]|nr:peptidoglycan-binding protein [Clostridia bacterium]
MQKKKSFKILMLVATNLALLILITDLCTLRSYAMNLGESGERIAAIQRSLSEKGYYFGEINGLYDFSTRKAVKKFDVENKLKNETDYEIISALELHSEGYECCCAEAELLAKHLKSNGIIEYHDMIDACEDAITNSENHSLFGYIIGMTENVDSLINAEPNSEQYSAAFQTLKRLKNY